jgi:hypothetical protein
MAALAGTPITPGPWPREVIDRSPTALTPWETSWRWHRWPSLTRASAVS